MGRFVSQRDPKWVELDGKAHIIREDPYLTTAMCGRPLTDSTVIMLGDDLEGCMDCITVFAEQRTNKRPDIGLFDEDRDWPDM